MFGLLYKRNLIFNGRNILKGISTLDNFIWKRNINRPPPPFCVGSTKLPKNIYMRMCFTIVYLWSQIFIKVKYFWINECATGFYQCHMILPWGPWQKVRLHAFFAWIICMYFQAPTPPASCWFFISLCPFLKGRIFKNVHGINLFFWLKKKKNVCSMQIPNRCITFFPYMVWYQIFYVFLFSKKYKYSPISFFLFMWCFYFRNRD